MFDNTWDYTRRSDQEEGTYRNIHLDYNSEGATNDGNKYNLEESINFLPGYALGHINFEAEGLKEHASFLIMKPSDYLYVLEADIDGQPKLVLTCVRNPELEFCEDWQKVGHFMISVWQSDEKDCISVIDDRMNSWADACYVPESDTWLRDNHLFDADITSREWKLVEIDEARDSKDDEAHDSKDDSDRSDEMAEESGRTIADFLEDMFDGATHVSAFGAATLAMMIAHF